MLAGSSKYVVMRQLIAGPVRWGEKAPLLIGALAMSGLGNTYAIALGSRFLVYWHWVGTVISYINHTAEGAREGPWCGVQSRRWRGPAGKWAVEKGKEVRRIGSCAMIDGVREWEQ
jgi:hypothetical protein